MIRAFLFILFLVQPSFAEDQLGVGIPYAVDKLAESREPLTHIVMANLSHRLLRGSELELAQSVSVLNDAIELSLKPELRFANGDLLRAEDVIYSLRSNMLSNAFVILDSPYVESRRKASRIRLEGGITLEDVAKFPIVQSDLAQLLGSDFGEHTFSPYLGPFFVRDNRPEDGVELERNVFFYRPGYPRVKGVSFRVLETAAAALSALRVGGIDIIALPTAELREAVSEDPTLIELPSPLRDKSWDLVHDYWSDDGNPNDRLQTDVVIVRKSLKVDERFKTSFDLSGCYLP